MQSVSKKSCKKPEAVCDVAGEGGSNDRNATENKQQNINMKTLTKLALAALLLATTFAANAGWVNGYSRNDGSYVSGYYRASANCTPYDNLSYRGYPSQQPGYVSPRSYGLDSSWSRPTPLPSYGSYNFQTPRPYTGGYSPTPLYRRFGSLGF